MTRVPSDPATGQPVEHLQERIDLLFETFQADGETIILPTPVLSEFLVLAKADGQKYLEKIDKNPVFQIKSFDRMAAIELAALRLEAENAVKLGWVIGLVINPIYPQAAVIEKSSRHYFSMISFCLNSKPRTF